MTILTNGPILTACPPHPAPSHPHSSVGLGGRAGADLLIGGLQLSPWAQGHAGLSPVTPLPSLVQGD